MRQFVASRIGLAGSLAMAVFMAGAIWGETALAQGGAMDDGKGSQDVIRHITVTASGSVAAAPDMARVTAGVASEAGTAKAALDKNSATMREVLKGLSDAGIADEDVKTTGFRVSPRYQHDKGARLPEIQSYSVSNDVHVAVRDLEKLGPLLDQLVKLGANQIGGLSFDIANSDELEDEARKKAIENARKRAELYAQAAGATLGEVLTISEGSSTIMPRGPVRARMAMAESVPIAEGQQEISVQVTVSYRLQ